MLFIDADMAYGSRERDSACLHESLYIHLRIRAQSVHLFSLSLSLALSLISAISLKIQTCMDVHAMYVINACIMLLYHAIIINTTS